MKRFYCAACALAITISAGSALALEKMDVKAKSSVTGQAGVTIAFDGVTATTTINKVSYGDEDGVGAGTTAGYIVVDGVITQTATLKKELTIDAATVTADAGFKGENSNTPNITAIAKDKSFVQIGLPDLSVSMADTEFDLLFANVDADTASKTANGANSIGAVRINSMTSAINGGKIYIYPH